MEERNTHTHTRTHGHTDTDTRTHTHIILFHVYSGNNLYGGDLLRVLQEVKGSEERMAYILMEKIKPAPVHNILLRRDAPLKLSSCLCELGVFGAYVR